MKKLKEFIITFGFGAIIYSAIEVLFRGFTHWTMTITGGITFVLLYLVNITMKTKNIILRCFTGSLIITVIEFTVGCIVNRALNMHVWDYSTQKYNILGQICPLFSALWFLLCLPATILSFALKKKLR